jgi:hypothetical protein
LLRRYGRVVRPALGVTLAPPQVLQRLGQQGVLVLEVRASARRLCLRLCQQGACPFAAN